MKKIKLIITFTGKHTTRSLTIYRETPEETTGSDSIEAISDELKSVFENSTFSGTYSVLQPELEKTRVITETVSEETGKRVSKTFTLYEIPPEDAKDAVETYLNGISN